MITYFTNQNAFYFDIEMNCVVMLDLHFHAVSYLFEWDTLYCSQWKYSHRWDEREKVSTEKIQ